MLPLYDISTYFRLHDWEWIPEDQIIAATGCKKQDVREWVTRNNQSVDTLITDGVSEYRYIGNIHSSFRQAILYIRDMYPNWVSVSQITKGSKGRNVSTLLCNYIGYIPVERRRVYVCRKLVVQYRYIPGTKLSLQEREIAVVHTAAHKRVDDIYNIIKDHSGEWLSARMIAEINGSVNGRNVSTMLRELLKHNLIEFRSNYNAQLESYVRYYHVVGEVACQDVR